MLTRGSTDSGWQAFRGIVGQREGLRDSLRFLSNSFTIIKALCASNLRLHPLLNEICEQINYQNRFLFGTYSLPSSVALTVYTYSCSISDWSTE